MKAKRLKDHLYRLLKSPGKISVAIIAACFTFLSATIYSQPYTISGQVFDSETRQALAFVNIVVNQSNIGGVSDIDGRFSLSSKEPVEFLRFSYVGYSQQIYYVEDPEFEPKIMMKRITVSLPEIIVIAGENPAHRIINNAVNNRDINNYEKLPAFSYTSYDKMIFTVDADSLMKADTLTADSSIIRLKNILDEQHLFIMETVAQRKFLYPGRNHQTIIASRVSGLKDPFFIFLLSHIQSTSFYDDVISISDKNYLNPISKGSISRYSFIIEDTLLMSGSHDTTFIISYKPKPNLNFDGLKGLLYINSNRWAIQNVIAEPALQEKGMSVKIQQMYQLIDGLYWFPVQLNTDIIFKTAEVNTFYPVGQGRSYITDIELNPNIVKKIFDEVSIELDHKATHRSAEEWEKLRSQGLTEKDLRTYQVIDSLGQAHNFDRIALLTETLVNGNIPLGKFNIPMHRLMRLNRYEKLYLGFGLSSSQQISKVIGAGAYIGYGFGDKKFKYGGDISLTFNHFKDSRWFLRYENDLNEVGKIESFIQSSGLIHQNAYRNWLINQMDNTKTVVTGIQHRFMSYLLSTLEFQRVNNMPQYEYTYFKQEGEPYSAPFIFTELRARFRFQWREKFVQTTRSRLSLGSDYPIIFFQYTKGLKGMPDGDFPHNRYELKIEHTFYKKLIGKTSVQINAGLIDSNVPYQKLFSGFSSYSRVAIHSPGSFATMRLNEFSTDRYLNIFLTHNFGKLLIRTRKFEPEFQIATHVGFGKLQKQDQQYHSIVLNDYRKGFIESGLFVNNLLNMQFYNIGAGIFYRYGHYSLKSFKENITLQFNLNFPF